MPKQTEYSFEKCPKCGGIIINGIHYIVRGDTPHWTEEELRIMSKIPFGDKE